MWMEPPKREEAAMAHELRMHASETRGVLGMGNAHLQLLDEAALVSSGMLGAVQLGSRDCRKLC